jgi:hypothetical protein
VQILEVPRIGGQQGEAVKEGMKKMARVGSCGQARTGGYDDGVSGLGQMLGKSSAFSLSGNRPNAPMDSENSQDSEDSHTGAERQSQEQLDGAEP